MPTEKKITYLIGAGASANAVPMVNTFAKSIERILYNIRDDPRNNNGFQFEEALTLIKEIQNHHTIDTLARKYWLISDFDKYNKIKVLITLLVLYHNICDKIEYPEYPQNKPFRNLDYRYDSFLATFLKSENGVFSLQPKIQFISWNYDIQFEKALSYYDKKDNLLKSIETFQPYLTRLNGVGIFDDITFHKYYSFDGMNETEIFNFFVSILNFENTIKTNIQFAWEITDPKEDYNKTSIKHMKVKIENAKNRISESDYVIVIGYSFPVFNRRIDIDLFKGFKGKIFIQNTELQANQIKNQLSSIQTGLDSDSRCEIQTNVDQFFIPNQFWTDIELKKPGKIIAVEWT